MAAIGEIGEVIGIISDCCGAGGFMFEKLASKLNTIAAVGGVVKDVIDIFKPDEHKEIMNKLAQLEGKLDELSRKMTDKIDELKAFMTQYHFYTDFAEIAFVLMKYVKNTIKHPNKDNYAILFSESQRTRPQDSVYHLNFRLSNKTTSPLAWAMNVDQLMTKNTYYKWRHIIEGVLSQFLFLETYCNGIFWHKNMIVPNQLKEDIHGIMKLMDNWKQEYLRNDYFWPGKVERLVHETQDRHMNVGNIWKAEHLQNRLNEVLTDSIFYVFVYNDCAGYNHHAFYGRTDHFYGSFRRGKCNVVIYRSRDYRFANDHDKHALRAAVESFTWWRIPLLSNYKNWVEQTYKSGNFHNHALVGIIDADKDVAIRTTSDKDPGRVITAHTRNPDRKQNFWFIVGYK